MAVIKKNGAPDKHTKGSIGDTYIDVDTGKSYICTFAFGDSIGSSEFEWKPSIEPEKIPGVDFQKNKTEPSENLPKGDSEIVQENIEEAVEKHEHASDRPKYNNYRKQYKN